ncbi:MAG: flagellar hook-associated protein FlgK [Devosiaceae bacterium]|nr:flagellar hook-associated protein FlgK [Devosiaceae bacterium MH13]
MSISTAMNLSISGLSTTQDQLNTVAGNVANSETPGYTRKEYSQYTTSTGGVQTGTLNRQLDEMLQSQIRSESSENAYLSTMNDYNQRLDSMLGAPGSASAFDTLVADFSTSLEQLGDNPSSYTAQQAVLTDAEVLADSLNSMSNEVQDLRESADQGIANSVASINASLQELDEIEATIRAFPDKDQVPADMLDERDRILSNLAQELDIQVLEQSNGNVSVFTSTGVTLFDGTPAVLRFDQTGQISPNSQYSADPNQSSLGTITVGQGNNTIDLLASGDLSSGNLGAYVELRDETLPEMQARLDEFAHQMSLAMSTTTVSSGALDPAVAGFDGLQLDLSSIQPGNTVEIGYETTPGGAQTVTLVHVTDPAALPLPQNAVPGASGPVIGVDLTDPAVVNAALTTAGIPVTAQAGAGGDLQLLDDGAVGAVDITSAEARVSTTSLQNGSAALPLFTDGAVDANYYTGSFDGVEQKTGYASRITVNADLLDDPTALNKIAADTPAGDSTRADFLSSAFTDTEVTISPDTGLGSSGAPMSLTLDDFAREIVNITSREAQNVQSAAEGQQLVMNSLLERQNAESGVNIDAEIARLTELQTIYSANAQVLNAAVEMMEELLAI